MSILPEGHQAECSISCILFVFLWVWLKIALSPNLFDNVRWDGLVPSWRALVNFLLAKGTASCEHNLPSCFVIWAQVRMLAAQVGISRILSPDSFDSPLRTYLNVDSNHGPRCHWNSQRFAFCFKPVYRTTMCHINVDFIRGAWAERRWMLSKSPDRRVLLAWDFGAEIVLCTPSNCLNQFLRGADSRTRSCDGCLADKGQNSSINWDREGLVRLGLIYQTIHLKAHSEIHFRDRLAHSHWEVVLVCSASQWPVPKRSLVGWFNDLLNDWLGD